MLVKLEEEEEAESVFILTMNVDSYFLSTYSQMTYQKERKLNIYMYI